MTTKHHIDVSEKTLQEFEKLKDAIAEVYSGHTVSNDQVLEAMIMGFWDSLEHIKAHHAQGPGHHHHHGDNKCAGDECCGEGKCEDDGKCKCC